MKKITIGITAHVDSGKTTLAEAMLYKSGTIRRVGRVDNGNSALDTNNIERSRGITIFSHQAEFTVGDTRFFLLDTPGHTDFLAETERTMPVLDYAVLVISGTDGVQSHTVTLWKLLQKYEIPVFIFVNKMDITNIGKQIILDELKRRLSDKCTDFSGDGGMICENSAICSEELMEKYFSDGILADNDIAQAINERKIFPCFFGSALKMDGIEKFLEILRRFTSELICKKEFGAKVYKISYDPKGSRLTHLKITGGQLKMRGEISFRNKNNEDITEKISSIRFYSGEKFRTADFAGSGDVCAVTGLNSSYAGQGLGLESGTSGLTSEPVMTYYISVPDNKNINDVLSDMRRLEDEDPQLHILWNDQLREIQIQLMGTVQLEVLKQLIQQRFGYDVRFLNGVVAYKETIGNTVEGVGHYEPLRHYAEVHLIMEPLECGSGLQFDVKCSQDILDTNWQRLILTHLQEKTHIGALTGSPITDMKLTLVSGKAHLKHTEGGDFRQATYRAVRQGLRQANKILLEPCYEYELELPTECVGRAIADLQHMCADFSNPENISDMSVIRGIAPVSEMSDYQAELISYTRGRGRLSLCVCGYRECHNTENVIESIGYDCDGDIDNTADSVFCSHGAGVIVKWNEVHSKMHLSSCLEAGNESKQPIEKSRKFSVSDEELMEIFQRTYGKLKTEPRRAFKKTKAVNIDNKPVKLPDLSRPEYLLVDGYNIIFAWDELKKIATESLDAARSELINMMCNYQGYDGSELILVFDAYKVKGKHREVEKYLNISIVYTKESETADSYIERVTHELSRNYRVRVATSDGPEQLIIFGSGAMRISADEFHKRYVHARNEIREFIDNMNNNRIDPGR